MLPQNSLSLHPQAPPQVFIRVKSGRGNMKQSLERVKKLRVCTGQSRNRPTRLGWGGDVSDGSSSLAQTFIISQTQSHVFVT